MWSTILLILADIAKVIAALEAVFGPSQQSSPNPAALEIVNLAVDRHTARWSPPPTLGQVSSLKSQILSFLSANSTPPPGTP